MYRLAVLTSHPIQYQAPLFRKLAQHPQIDLIVYFCWDFGVGKPKTDPEFGIAYTWDVPLLEGYRYEFLKNYSPSPGPARAWGLVNPSIIKRIRKGRFDAVILHGYTHVTTMLAYLAAWSSGTAILFRGETVLRAGQSIYQRLLKRSLLTHLFKRTQAFLAIGSRSREFYECYGVPRERIFLSPYAVDNEFFLAKHSELNRARNDLRTKLGVNSQTPIILFVGKLSKRKRPLDLLRAFQIVRRSNDAALIFVGEGDERSYLERYVSENRISNVLFVGFKNQTQLPPFYEIADIFVLPSEYEPWGLVINEAMCFGLPIIATDDVAAVSDLVRDGENGYVYHSGDVDTLARLLQHLLLDSASREEMGEKSKQIVSVWNLDGAVNGILESLGLVTRTGRTQKTAAFPQ